MAVTSSLASRVSSACDRGGPAPALGPRRRHDNQWSVLARKRRRSPLRPAHQCRAGPDPENRITLGPSVIDWAASGGDPLRGEPDRHELGRIHTILADELARSGLGRVVIHAERVPDPNAHHHMGTTRMHAIPAGGCRSTRGVTGSPTSMRGQLRVPDGRVRQPNRPSWLSLAAGDHLKAQI